jgi:hypothetical protein
MLGQRGLQECWHRECPGLTHLDLNYNQVGDAEAERFAGVLAQYTALVHLVEHLDLRFNRIGG